MGTLDVLTRGEIARRTILAKLMAKIVERSGECWLTYREYEQFWHMGQFEAAHKVSYQLHKGAVPEGLHVLHSCDEPRCINPEHLRVGTPSDNAEDKSSRGRVVCNPYVGSQNSQSKLTEVEVTEILLEYRAGNISQNELGRKYGVNGAVVHNIVSGKRWKHVYAQMVQA